MSRRYSPLLSHAGHPPHRAYNANTRFTLKPVFEEYAPKFFTLGLDTERRVIYAVLWRGKYFLRIWAGPSHVLRRFTDLVPNARGVSKKLTEHDRETMRSMPAVTSTSIFTNGIYVIFDDLEGSSDREKAGQSWKHGVMPMSKRATVEPVLGTGVKGRGD